MNVDLRPLLSPRRYFPATARLVRELCRETARTALVVPVWDTPALRIGASRVWAWMVDRQTDAHGNPWWRLHLGYVVVCLDADPFRTRRAGYGGTHDHRLDGSELEPTAGQKTQR